MTSSGETLGEGCGPTSESHIIRSTSFGPANSTAGPIEEVEQGTEFHPTSAMILFAFDWSRSA